MRHWLLALLLAASGAVAADEMVRICHGYGCLAQTDIRYTEGQLGEVRRMLFAAVDAEIGGKMLVAGGGVKGRAGGDGAAVGGAGRGAVCTGALGTGVSEPPPIDCIWTHT